MNQPQIQSDMGQYDIAKMLYNSEGSLSFKQIHRKTGNVESSDRTALHKLIQKELVIDVDSGKEYKWNPDASEDDLESIRTYTIEELRD